MCDSGDDALDSGAILVSDIPLNVIRMYGAISRKQKELFKVVIEGSPKKWEALRKIHALQHQVGAYDPYPVDWHQIFTPIERECWLSIRQLGGMPFYPQYPVGRFFVDFADPACCIAIECDGAQWHDAGKDAARDAEMREFGWCVYRLTGRQCLLPDSHPDSAFCALADIGASYYQRWPGQYNFGQMAVNNGDSA